MQIAAFGDEAVAGWAVIGRILPVAFGAVFALSGAVGPIVGQNVGAGRYDRVRATITDSLVLTLAYVVVVWALLRLFRTLPLHGLYDGIARVLFASWQAYALAHGAPKILVVFLVVEVSFGGVQLLPWSVDGLRGRARTRQVQPPVR